MSSQTTSEAEPGGGGGTTTTTTAAAIKETPSTVFTEQLISDYVEYLKVDCSLEKTHFAESIEEMLTKLDEFCGLVDMKYNRFIVHNFRQLNPYMDPQRPCGPCLRTTELNIRGDTTLCLYKTMPEIEVKASEMQRLFVKIDQLEELVTIVSKNVSLMEEQVNNAEAKMGSFSGIKKMITSLVSPKHSATRNKSQEQYHPPEIFNTSDFFPKQS
ncbi:biogenesis of lysosome-related organelles complex 1 subunit 4 isoform X1 [Octopus bimaculoides]|uniref:biogenesis of lysosome-related organelles complex 1 subunit 4 isoform X1 n=1 Tax=Octopus bimaculoides TaxID=37653 RepID=UPI0022E7337F|nr:biogenesis of lysosome-related organelles complex 1 subunit 4 isoform X1 [Octopus bimaculoides]